MSSVWDKVKEANQAIDPEESVAVRGAVLFTVLVAVVALLQEGQVGALVAGAALFGIPAGFFTSWKFRHADALGFKAFLAVALIAAVGIFFGDLAAAADNGFVNVQKPLAELFLWVQIIHSLHVPARRDLMFSITSSGVMIALTAASSISLSIGPFIVVWMAGVIVSLMLAYRSGINDLPLLAPSDDLVTRGIAKSATMGLLAMALLGALAFAMVPAARVSRAFTFPVELPASFSLASPGALSNPTLGEGGDASSRAGEDGFAGRSTTGYFGFAEQLDTSLRGRPDETLVMRVRAPAPAFWKGQTFDTWDGRVWTNSDDTTVSIGGGPPIQVRPTVGSTGPPGEEFLQTFYLEARGPNIVFGAHAMTDVYFGDRFLFEMTDGTVLAGVDLEPGTVYTVVSSRPHITADFLRSSRGDIPVDVAARYLQVPAATPNRVIQLAQELAQSEPTTYDKVKAMEAWMGANTTYTLDIPPLESGQDTVDEFLFETRQGFCEQIGTSLVVMLRSQGIPARLVVGFTPGERNPFTGLYEVRGRDAHSWAEVYFPGIGWQSFDPTAQVPLSGDFELGAASSGLTEYVAARLGFLTALGGAIASIVGAVMFLGAMSALGLQIWNRRKARRARSWSDDMLDRIEEAGAARGRPRRIGETTREYVTALSDGPLPDSRLADVVESVSTAHLGSGVISPEAQQQAERLLNDILNAHPTSARERVLALSRYVGR